MKNILAGFALLVLAAVSAQAQGLIVFSAGVSSSTRISTNSFISGPANGLTDTGTNQFYYALYYSRTATSVNGQTAPLCGNTNTSYAFTDTNWTFAGYGTNTAVAGHMVGSGTGSGGAVVISNVPGGSTAQFVVIGWSASLGHDISGLQTWLASGSPVMGFLGQSAVSGPQLLGDGGIITTPNVFGSGTGQVAGFVLGLTADSSPIATAPYITSQPTNLTVSVGSSASFSVTAYGYPAPTYQWMFNGTNIIPGAVGPVLNLSNAQLTNAGTYSVSIVNSAGSTNSDAATLSVYATGGVPPTISHQPSDAVVAAGNNATFSVTADGTAPLNYQWTFNGTNLPGATNPSLTISGAQAGNAGSYAVLVSNSYGATNSATVVLTVQQVPPSIFGQPGDLTVQAGDSATFTVTVSGSTPMTFQWSFNGTNISGATGASLSLANVQAANAGQYAVAVSNFCGATNSYAATLSVTPPQNGGYMIFANTALSISKMFTNSAVGGQPTGMTWGTQGLYRYALYASATATSVNGQSSPILGADSLNYAFNDPNWTLVAYGASTSVRGRFSSLSTDPYGETPIPGIPGGTYAQFVIIGWSANIGATIPAVQSWFNNGNPGSDGWIGQSAVSGALLLGDDFTVPALPMFGTAPGQVKGFTLGLASPTPAAAYPVPYAPPAILQTTLSGGSLQLSWSNAAGSFGVQYAPSPVGPWNDLNVAITVNGATSSIIVPAGKGPFYRLITQ